MYRTFWFYGRRTSVNSPQKSLNLIVKLWGAVNIGIRYRAQLLYGAKISNNFYCCFKYIVFLFYKLWQVANPIQPIG